MIFMGNPVNTIILNLEKNIIKSNIIYFNCAYATLICVNQNKQNGSHNTPLKELGRDQFSPLQVLRPIIWIKYTYLLSSPNNVYSHNLGSRCVVCHQIVSFERRESS
jgi:hypothetical protein